MSFRRASCSVLISTLLAASTAFGQGGTVPPKPINHPDAPYPASELATPH